ncbi:MAG: hypothetical protein HYZ14_03160 [Bacteroidetes bacterium]|nr:hypothetical protein [Bacteroidota bacterium]
MKNSLRNNITFIVITVAVLGCRKDTPVPVIPNPPDGCTEDWCHDFPPEPGFGYVFTSSGTQYLSPCFNPNNNDEFVFLRTGVSANAELVKYTISTKEESVLCNSVPIATAPKWGKQGWIVFSTTNWKVWKIKDDGTQLTQLTFDVNDQFPMFNFEGDRVIYARMKNYTNFELEANPDLYNEYKMMVIDLNGNFVDSVMAPHVVPGNYYQNWTTAAVDENNQFFFVGEFEGIYSGIYRVSSDLDNVTSSPVVSLYSSSPIGLVTDIVYANGNVYYTRFREALYKGSTSDGSRSKIKIGCRTRYYHHLSISNDGSKLLVQKVISTPLDEVNIDVQNEVWLLEIDGCGTEQVIGE